MFPVLSMKKLSLYRSKIFFASNADASYYTHTHVTATLNTFLFAYLCNLQTFQALEVYSPNFPWFTNLCGSLANWNFHHTDILYGNVKRWMSSVLWWTRQMLFWASVTFTTVDDTVWSHQTICHIYDIKSYRKNYPRWLRYQFILKLDSLQQSKT